jgi:hypothetical protein
MFAARHDVWKLSKRTKDLKPDLILSDLALPRLKRLESDAKCADGSIHSVNRSRPQDIHHRIVLV